jgi:hypothetical protein
MVGRAESRAAVLQGLHKAYSAKATTKRKTPTSASAPTSFSSSTFQAGAASTSSSSAPSSSSASHQGGQRKSLSPVPPTEHSNSNTKLVGKPCTDASVAIVQGALSSVSTSTATNGNKVEKTRQFFSDQLHNKSIVLENSAPSDTSKFGNRMRYIDAAVDMCRDTLLFGIA